MMWIRLIILIVLAFYFSGCSGGGQTFTAIDREFVVYTTDFSRLYGHLIPDVVIDFYDGASASGMCSVDDAGQRRIHISRELWDSYCPEQRRGVIFHELGHCVLGRQHTANQLSYMYPEVRLCEFYMANIPIMDNELFP